MINKMEHSNIDNIINDAWIQISLFLNSFISFNTYFLGNFTRSSFYGSLGFIAYKISLEPIDIFISILLKILIILCVVMATIFFCLMIYYQARGGYVRIKRWLWKRMR